MSKDVVVTVVIRHSEFSPEEWVTEFKDALNLEPEDQVVASEVEL